MSEKKTILICFFLFNKIWLSVSECVLKSDNMYLIFNLLTLSLLQIFSKECISDKIFLKNEFLLN